MASTTDASHRTAPQRGLRPTSAWQRRNERGIQLRLALLAVSLAAGLLFAKLAQDYVDRDVITRWDADLSRWLHVHSSAALVSLFERLTYGGSVVLLGTIAAGTAVLLLRRRAVDEAALVCVGVLGIELITPLLKVAFHRPRPALAYVHLNSYSFPSGHAAASTAVFGILLYLLARDRSTLVRLASACAFVAVVSVVGFSRLYLEVHYLSDVLAGLCLGVSWAAACLFVYEVRLDRFSRSSRRLADGAGRKGSRAPSCSPSTRIAAPGPAPDDERGSSVSKAKLLLVLAILVGLVATSAFGAGWKWRLVRSHVSPHRVAGWTWDEHGHKKADA